MSLNNLKIFALGAFTLVALIAFVSWELVGPGINLWRSTIGRYEIAGVVTSAPGAKLTLSSEDGMKFGIGLRTAEGDVIVNCDSTQCSALTVGQQAVLSCFNEFHWFEPNETECRFDAVQ